MSKTKQTQYKTAQDNSEAIALYSEDEPFNIDDSLIFSEDDFGDEFKESEKELIFDTDPNIVFSEQELHSTDKSNDLDDDLSFQEYPDDNFNFHEDEMVAGESSTQDFEDSDIVVSEDDISDIPDHVEADLTENERVLESVSPTESDGVVEDFEFNSSLLPGTDVSASQETPDSDDATKSGQETSVDKDKQDWLHDRNPKFFQKYLEDKLSNIPKHSGGTTVGCERAITYLSALNKEISDAVKTDLNSEIPLEFLEKSRDYIESGIDSLKNRIKQIAKIRNAALAKSGFKKEAMIPHITYVMTPFERAVSGIIVNAVVAGGKPFDDVYNQLKKRFKFTSREELAIVQLIMDMGFPVFKDRGTIGVEIGDGDDSDYGVEFIKTYFA